MFYDQLRPVKALLNNATISVKIAEPITAHTIGNGLPSMVMVKISGNPNFPAIHKPIYAPIKPTMMDTRHPPKSYPARACPIEPQMAAISKRTKNPISVIV